MKENIQILIQFHQFLLEQAREKNDLLLIKFHECYIASLKDILIFENGEENDD